MFEEESYHVNLTKVTGRVERSVAGLGLGVNLRAVFDENLCYRHFVFLCRQVHRCQPVLKIRIEIV